MKQADDLVSQKYILLLDRDDLGLQNFAPDANLLSLNDVRSFIEKRSVVRKANGLPEETFFLAEVFPRPLLGDAVDDLWDDFAKFKSVHTQG